MLNEVDAVRIISISEAVYWPDWKKTTLVRDVTERSTVTKAETMKIVATPILYE